MKEKLIICGIPPTPKPPPFVLVLKNKRKIAERIRHQLHEEKLGNPMTMLGKDDDPFQGGKEEKGPSFTGGKQPTCAEARTPMRLRGRCWHSVALPAHPPCFTGGSFFAHGIAYMRRFSLRSSLRYVEGDMPH